MPEYKLISADSHVSEPPDLWSTRVDKKYRERAPQLMVNPPGKEGAYFHYEGYAPHPIGIGLGAGKSPEELKEFLTKATYADARPGGWDPAERVKDNAIDGVEAERIGLVSLCVPEDELEARALSIARRLAYCRAAGPASGTRAVPAPPPGRQRSTSANEKTPTW